MTNEERIALFSEELSCINDPTIRQFVSLCLAKAPEYFFHVPASSTGKYHPSYALGEGGLVRHTKAAVKIFQDLARCDASLWYLHDCNNELTATQFNDAATAALILHDTFKQGSEESQSETAHTVHEHPLFAADFVKRTYTPAYEERSIDLDTYKTLDAIRYAIASHMGKWNVSKYSSSILPTPDDWLSRVVHLCDLLASRKYLEVKFD